MVKPRAPQQLSGDPGSAGESGRQLRGGPRRKQQGRATERRGSEEGPTEPEVKLTLNAEKVFRAVSDPKCDIHNYLS